MMQHDTVRCNKTQQVVAKECGRFELDDDVGLPLGPCWASPRALVGPALGRLWALLWTLVGPALGPLLALPSALIGLVLGHLLG